MVSILYAESMTVRLVLMYIVRKRCRTESQNGLMWRREYCPAFASREEIRDDVRGHASSLAWRGDHVLFGDGCLAVLSDERMRAEGVRWCGVCGCEWL